MPPEDIPEDARESFPCECGGNIIEHNGEWCCDKCSMTMGGESDKREVIPLAAGLHSDGTIHIYVNEGDSGLSVALEANGTLIVRVDESKRAIRTRGD